ncbi:MAG: hypothetical protein ACTSXY_02575, partial [Promethearchaeota archaeon]
MERFEQRKRKRNLLTYLTILKKKRIDPNFWISFPYLNSIGAVSIHNNGWWWVEEDEKPLFPAISLREKESYPIQEGWADFANLTFPEGKTTFLDYEYLYRPSDFLNMKGSKWATFRKNARKWFRRNNGECCYTRKRVLQKEIEKLLIKWLDKGLFEVHDDEIIIKYLFDPPPETFHGFLLSSCGSLLGINCWDENYKYINYRISICDPEEPFLNEFCRLLFYQDSFIQNSHKLV